MCLKTGHLESFLIRVDNLSVNVVLFCYVLTLSCRSIYPMSSLKVFYHKLDYYNDVHISLEILNVFQPNLAEIWLMHYSVIKR